MILSPFNKIIYIDEYSPLQSTSNWPTASSRPLKRAGCNRMMCSPSTNWVLWIWNIPGYGWERLPLPEKAGIIGSVPQGCFIKECGHRAKDQSVPDVQSALTKRSFYDAFAAKLGDAATIDFYVYNNSFALFKTLIQAAREDYKLFCNCSAFYGWRRECA